MRTNIVLNKELVDKGMVYTGIKTKKELVEYALSELVRRKEQKEILKLSGKLKWEGDLDEMRRSRI
jgi:Arc/MetJ family transcription regulator